MNAPTINELKKIRKIFAVCANRDCDNNHQPHKRISMKFDTTTIIPFPTTAVWATFYTKFRKPIINMLNSGYCLADREDAVESAFHKLMHKKDISAYGENMPQTESDWFWSLYWQARAYLSHLSDRAEVHAKYVERTAKTLEEVFACGHQGEEFDREILGRALVRALETLKEEQDISRRNLEIYICRKKYDMPAKEVATKFNIKANNVDQIVSRVKALVEKHGPRHLEAALRREGYGFAA